MHIRSYPMHCWSCARTSSNQKSQPWLLGACNKRGPPNPNTCRRIVAQQTPHLRQFMSKGTLAVQHLVVHYPHAPDVDLIGHHRFGILLRVLVARKALERQVPVRAAANRSQLALPLLELRVDARHGVFVFLGGKIYFPVCFLI